MNANTPVLVLDVDFQALRIEHWQKVVADVFLGKVQVIEYSKDKTIKGITRDYPMPAVVRVLTRFRRERQAIRFSRLNIYTRDGFACQFCGERLASEELTFDHVIPRSKGGKTTWENIVASCVPCNAMKADRTPAEAGMKLRRTPKKPKFLPVVTVEMDRRHVPEEWQPYWSAVLDK